MTLHHIFRGVSWDLGDPGRCWGGLRVWDVSCVCVCVCSFVCWLCRSYFVMALHRQKHLSKK
jgi:hypothetical protein